MEKPTKNPDIEDYIRTNDISTSYFNGSYLEFTDSKGRLRIARISMCDNEHGMFHYNVVTLDGQRLSQNTFKKNFDQFRVIQNLPPTVFISGGTAFWGGGNGVHTNSKSSNPVLK